MKQICSKHGARALSAVTFAFLTMSAHAATPLSGEYSNGLKLKSEDGNFELKFGGRIHYDTAFLDGDDDIGDVPDGVEFRRVRHTLSGTIYGNTVYKAQLEFSKGSEVTFKDVYMGLKKTPLLGFGIRVGHYYQPFGLETQTSSNYMTFIERSLTHELAPDRRSGLMLHRSLGDRQGTLALSVFRSSNGQGMDEGDGLWNGAGRGTWTPLGTSSEEGFLHVGAAVAYRKNGDREFEAAAAPPAHLAPDMSEVAIPADDWMQYGAEAAYVRGPFSAQGEAAWINTRGGDQAEDAAVLGWYGMLSFFVTGESRPYSSSSGTFSRVKPKSLVDGKGGHGGLELAVRLSQMDLDDDALMAGTTTNLTVGANWYLHSQGRIMLNYVRSSGDGTSLPGADTGDPRISTDGVIHGVVTRFQIDF